jgi:L-ascorbate metabolism protein UlaG (beta-lactamase superfamily)
MFRTLAVWLLLACSALADGLDRYANLVVADPPGTKPGGLRVTYLGTNGYQLECNGRFLLVDPYFTRASLGRVGLGLPLRSDLVRVDTALARLAKKADVVIATHGHFDHALDLPHVMRATGAQLLAPATTVKLATLAGAPAEKSRTIRAGQTMRVGPWKITAVEARHDCIFGLQPFPGEVEGERIPRNAGDWKLGTPLAFLIEAGGKRVYVDAGGRPDGPVPRVGRVDLAIVGVALKDSRDRLPALLNALKPRYFLPSHQDDFFRSLEWGFRFGPLTDFPKVLRMHERLPGRLVLLDYFRPWTLR